MERSKSPELHLTEAELETLINAVRSTSGRFAELEFKLRAAWRRAHSRNLTTPRSLLMLAEANRAAFKTSPLAAELRMRGIQCLKLF
jgi:hypothetical protein